MSDTELANRYTRSIARKREDEILDKMGIKDFGEREDARKKMRDEEARRQRDDEIRRRNLEKSKVGKKMPLGVIKQHAVVHKPDVTSPERSRRLQEIAAMCDRMDTYMKVNEPVDWKSAVPNMDQQFTAKLNKFHERNPNFNVGQYAPMGKLLSGAQEGLAMSDILDPLSLRHQVTGEFLRSEADLDSNFSLRSASGRQQDLLREFGTWLREREADAVLKEMENIRDSFSAAVDLAQSSEGENAKKVGKFKEFCERAVQDATSRNSETFIRDPRRDDTLNNLPPGARDLMSYQEEILRDRARWDREETEARAAVARNGLAVPTTSMEAPLLDDGHMMPVGTEAAHAHAPTGLDALVTPLSDLGNGLAATGVHDGDHITMDNLHSLGDFGTHFRDAGMSPLARAHEVSDKFQMKHPPPLRYRHSDGGGLNQTKQDRTQTWVKSSPFDQVEDTFKNMQVSRPAVPSRAFLAKTVMCKPSGAPRRKLPRLPPGAKARASLPATAPPPVDGAKSSVVGDTQDGARRRTAEAAARLRKVRDILRSEGLVVSNGRDEDPPALPPAMSGQEVVYANYRSHHKSDSQAVPVSRPMLFPPDYPHKPPPQISGIKHSRDDPLNFMRIGNQLFQQVVPGGDDLPLPPDDRDVGDQRGFPDSGDRPTFRRDGSGNGGDRGGGRRPDYGGDGPSDPGHSGKGDPDDQSSMGSRYGRDACHIGDDRFFRQPPRHRPPQFDGARGWRGFYREFTRLSLRYAWKQEEKLDRLQEALTGEARDFVGTLPETVLYSFDSLVNELQNRYGRVDLPETARAKMTSLLQGDKTRTQFAAEVAEIALLGYPNPDHNELRAEAEVRTFLRGCSDKQAAMWAMNFQAKTLGEAQDLMDRFRSNIDCVFGDKLPSKARQVTFADETCMNEVPQCNKIECPDVGQAVERYLEQKGKAVMRNVREYRSPDPQGRVSRSEGRSGGDRRERSWSGGSWDRDSRDRYRESDSRDRYRGRDSRDRDRYRDRDSRDRYRDRDSRDRYRDRGPSDRGSRDRYLDQDSSDHGSRDRYRGHDPYDRDSRDRYRDRDDSIEREYERGRQRTRSERTRYVKYVSRDGRSPGGRSPSRDGCFICREQGHFARNCPKQDEICTRCPDASHYAKHCLRRDRSLSSDSRKDFRQGRS